MNRTSFVRLLPAALACVFSIAASPALAQTAPDNTKVNARDRKAGAVTADQQKENATDRDITKRIRQSVIGDKSLSTYAHNVKIVAQSGQVTLKGPVRTEAEKQAIESKATAVAGAGHVTNDITVTTSATAKSSKTPRQ